MVAPMGAARGPSTPSILGQAPCRCSVHVKTLEEETDESFGVPGERFILQELLGEGSFGAVYRCSREVAQGEEEEEYAVKVINATRIATLVGHPLELVCPRLKREVEILRHLGEHPHILKLHYAYYSEKTSRFYIVTELLKGGELFQAIIRRRRPFTEPEARLIFSQLVEAVVFCHKMGIAHRDLKLENCLFESRDSLNVKLCDYGQAKMLTGDGFTETAKTLTTTPAYTAPEVATAVQSEQPYDPFKADSFGLGVILYGLLCSALPDAAKGTTYERHRRWSDLSSEVRDLIRQLLVNNPAQRLSAADVLQHAWLAPLLSARKVGQEGASNGCSPPSPPRSGSSTPSERRLPLEAILAAQQVLVALQRERGTCCWALGDEEGERSFRWQLQYTDERFQEAERLLRGILDSTLSPDLASLQRALEGASGQLKAVRKQCAVQIKHRDDIIDGEADFNDAYSSYSHIVGVVIAAIQSALPRCVGSGLPSRMELKHRLLQLAAEQLGRERAFLTAHLSRPETLRLFAVVTQLAEIIGARKMLLGSCETSRKQGIIVASDTGLLPALQLMESPPIEHEDLSVLESVEERAMNSRRTDLPAVTEWWCHLTKVIDKIHQHAMVNLVEMFSRSVENFPPTTAG